MHLLLINHLNHLEDEFVNLKEGDRAARRPSGIVHA